MARFEFNLAAPFFEQLREFFDELGATPLDATSINCLDPLQGVYGLLLAGKLVYVGKSDGTLTRRLEDHRVKLSGRQNIEPADVRFRAAYLAKTWVPLTPEQNLIRHYQQRGECEWNGNGFGPHDPGRNREETNKPPDGFDQRYPIRLDFPMNLESGEYEANALLQQVKAALPYTFRYETDNPKGAWRRGSAKYNGRIIKVTDGHRSASEVISGIAEQLGSSWQATAFPSHIILYEEHRTYSYGTAL